MERIVRVRSSRELGVWPAFWAEMIASGLVLLASVISGIKAFALAPTFGSWQDYITLFTWGASLDQSRNFLQSLGTSAPARDRDAPAGQAATTSAATAQRGV